MFEQNCEKQPLICVPVGSSPDTVCYMLKRIRDLKQILFLNYSFHICARFDEINGNRKIFCYAYVC